MEIVAVGRPGHRAQLGVYFLLIEEQLGCRTVAWLHRLRRRRRGTAIENTDELRAWVLDLAGQIRAARAAVMSADPGQSQAKV